MWRVLPVPAAAVLIAALYGCGFSSAADDLCQRCECLPTQAICRANGSAPKVFNPATTDTNQESLELIYIYGIETVNFAENSIVTKKPVTILIQNCTTVNIFDRAVEQLRTLVVRDSGSVRLGVLNRQVLWATLLENIEELHVDASSLSANYSVSIEHVESLTVQRNSTDAKCEENIESTFSMYGCKVKPLHHGDMLLCSGHITIEANTFESIEEEGLQAATEGSIALVYNTFKQVKKQSLNLTAPLIHISGNRFEHLPAGALRGVSTLQDTFFTNNVIQDIDLGGVLLDMGWDMVLEGNSIECDCASKRTSILNPKEDLLYLTNSSFEKLHINFMNNFCNLNCTVSLEMFSYALSQGTVCVTNSTRLEHELLCNITVELESTTPSSTDPDSSTTSTPTTTHKSFVFSSASRAELLVPLSIVVVVILITSSVCYGCREMNTFKFTFSPSRVEQVKLT